MRHHFNKFHYFAFFVAMNLLCYSKLLVAKDDTYLLQSNTHASLAEVHQDMEKGEFTKAKTKLEKLLQTDGLKDYDAAVIYQALGYVENSLGNFSEASKSFQKSLSLNALPKEITHELYFTTAQLLVHTEQAEEALKYLAKWFAEEPQPKADAHILAASAYYQTENYQQLIVHVEKALALTKNPPLNWYELLLAAYYEIKDFEKAAAVLEKIIVQYPNKADYWLQLAGIYQQQEQDKKALAIYELAYSKELLKEDDILQLIKSYLYLQMPYKAGVVLEKELAIGGVKDNREMLDLLVDSWLLAQETEKAGSVLKEIIKRFNDDTARLRLGQIYIESEQWKKATELLDVKIESNDKTLLSKINLLLGIAQYHTDNLGKATHAFTQALSDKSTEEQAKWWLDHLKKKTETTQES